MHTLLHDLLSKSHCHNTRRSHVSIDIRAEELFGIAGLSPIVGGLLAIS